MSAVDWLGVSRICCCVLALIVAFATLVFDHYRGFSEGYDIAKNTFSNWGNGFKEGWNACRKYMVLNHAGNYNEVKQERKDDE